MTHFRIILINIWKTNRSKTDSIKHSIISHPSIPSYSKTPPISQHPSSNPKKCKTPPPSPMENPHLSTNKENFSSIKPQLLNLQKRNLQQSKNKSFQEKLSQCSTKEKIVSDLISNLTTSSTFTTTSHK